ncbi:MAG: tetratricopeptide repeat protein [Alphaproteobacteria bacterium]|nr:tetratricopeptide repeat protein [Alphaproteobacteria bacterium]
MPNTPLTPSLEAYYGTLEVIDGIKFTPREIDIIACILNGRRRKSTAFLLSISDKTAETHVRNIMRKLECSSQESIRSKLEKSDKLNAIKSHYANLLAESFFERTLQNVSLLTSTFSPTCLLLYHPQESVNLSFVSDLEKHLKQAGITPLLQAIEKETLETSCAKMKELKSLSCALYVMSELKPSESHKNYIDLKNAIIVQELVRGEKPFVFISINQHTTKDFFKDEEGISFLNLSEQTNRYFAFFEILKRILPIDLAQPIANFKEEYAIISGTSGKTIHTLKSHKSTQAKEDSVLLERFSRQDKNNVRESKKDSKHNGFKYRIKKKYHSLDGTYNLNKRRFIIGGALCVIVSSTFLIYFYSNKIGDLNKKEEIQTLSSVRSDLVLPTESVFLERSDLINQIDNKLKNQEGIQTIALVGTGGAGKTTLARKYARQQKANFIWEINAETQGNLNESFENLAHTLSRSEEDKKTLKEILELKNTAKREEEILLFVKDRLRLHANWFLIFDNMEKFSDIQKYLPKDDETWGQGKIILTTRDGNIQNNKHINDIIPVGVLDESQKLDLFNKIMNAGNPSSHLLSQEDQTKAFLKEIPSFPLDVSLAAYYIKATKIPYSTYLENLNQYDQDFATVQENLLKESGEYTKTRYSIIALSLEHLLKAHQDFGDLMLLMCLVDSQEIPRELLSSYKGENVAGNFIYNLEKYSLAMTNPSPAPLFTPTLSIHRSMQGIIFNYLINTLKLAKKDKAPKEISQTLASSINHAIEKEDIRKMKLLARHGNVFLKHAHLLSEESKGPLGAELGRTYFYLGDYKKADELFQVSLPYIQVHGNENIQKTAKILDILGVIYRELGNYPEAEKTLEKSLAIYEQYDPQNYREIAHTLTHLGSIHKELGNDNKAKSVLERSLPLYQKCPPKSEKDSLWTLVHLGMVHRDLGDYQKAINVFQESLHIYKTHFPENYVRQASVLASLGNVYNLAGDHVKAKEVLSESIAIYKKYFSENDRGYTSATVYLADAHKALNEYQQAKELFTKSLKFYENYYGKDHIEVARILRKLGKLYYFEGLLEVAESTLNQALQTFQKINHPESSLALKELSEIQLKKSGTTSHE